MTLGNVVPFNGDQSILLTTPVGGVVAGNIYSINSRVYVSRETLGAGVTGSFIYDGPVLVNKTGGDSFVFGSPVYHNTGTGLATSTAGGNALIGAAIMVAAGGDSSVRVNLDMSGTAGATGPTGATGATGLTVIGQDGSDGEDAPIIPGPAGANGTNGANGADGGMGPMGVPGFDGNDGEDAPIIPGPVGATGSTGATGATGSTGPQGIPGMDGNDGEDGLTIISTPSSSTSSAVRYFYDMISNPVGLLTITGATSATLNSMHVVSGTSADYTITISGLSPTAGDVLGFYVKDYAAADKQYKLDAGGTVKIAGRTRYLILLHTNVVLLRWDGTDWQPLVLNLDTPWVDAGAMTITGSTSNPSRGGGTTYDFTWWQRRGDTMFVRMEQRQTTGGGAGSGNYRWAIPIGAIDTTKVTATTAGTSASVAATAGLGGGSHDLSGTSYYLFVTCYDATNIRIQRDKDGLMASTVSALSTATWRMHVWYHAPMLDW